MHSEIRYSYTCEVHTHNGTTFTHTQKVFEWVEIPKNVTSRIICENLEATGKVRISTILFVSLYFIFVMLCYLNVTSRILCEKLEAIGKATNSKILFIAFDFI